MKIKIILIFFLTFILTGCYDYKELNNISIVTAMSIDKKNNNYDINFLIPNVGNEDKKSLIYNGIGKKIEEILSQTNISSSKSMYIDHMSVIIVSEQVAKEGMNEIAEFIIKRLDKSSNINLFIAKDKSASSILKNISPSELNPMDNFISSITSSNKFRNLISDSAHNEFIKKYLDEGDNPTVLSIGVINKDEENTQELSLDFDNLGIFYNDRLVSWADEKTSKTINVINNKIHETTIQSECNNEYVFYTLKELKSNITIDISQSSLKFNVTVKGSHYLDEIDCDLNKNDKKIINNLKIKLEKELKKILDDSIHKLQNNYKSDVLGLGKLIYISDPDYWYRIKQKWDIEIYPKVEINTDVVIDLKI